MRLFAASVATETNTFSPIQTWHAGVKASLHAPKGVG